LVWWYLRLDFTSATDDLWRRGNSVKRQTQQRGEARRHRGLLTEREQWQWSTPTATRSSSVRRKIARLRLALAMEGGGDPTLSASSFGQGRCGGAVRTTQWQGFEQRWLGTPALLGPCARRQVGVHGAHICGMTARWREKADRSVPRGSRFSK
jgi:hypothetical protein